MATAASPPYRITVEQFLAIEWDSDTKAELDNGVIRMMAGGSAAHSRVQGNIFAALFGKMRGTPCRPHGPDMGVRSSDLSLRYPDISVFCGREGPENDKLQQFDDPKMVVEVLSPTTREKDEGIKLIEYQAITSLDAILHVDPDAEMVRLLTRIDSGGWEDAELETGQDVVVGALGVMLTWNEIFAR